MEEMNAQGLNVEEKKTLLKMARKTVEFYLDQKKKPSIEELGFVLTDSLKKERGVFVTLHQHGNLRGCIGEIFPRRSLYLAVIEQAIHSAFQDPRFKKVTQNELSSIEFEISVLTPPESVKFYKDIVVGKHGIVLEKGWNSAVFLPQVAPEQGWDLETTLKYLSMKAGLSSDDWKEGASFQVFEAIVFSE